jgi:hypothetical protein
MAAFELDCHLPALRSPPPVSIHQATPGPNFATEPAPFRTLARCKAGQRYFAQIIYRLWLARTVPAVSRRVVAAALPVYVVDIGRCPPRIMADGLYRSMLRYHDAQDLVYSVRY